MLSTHPEMHRSADPTSLGGPHPATKLIGIIGAGPGGLCLGIKLRDAGYGDFVIWERAAGVGGTWRINTYPGCAVDVMSHLYSYSFRPKHDWRRPYDTQPEVLRYLEECTQTYGLEPHLRFNTTVVAAHWDETTSTWTVHTEGGDEYTVDILLSAQGMFNRLAWPRIQGWGSFGGTVIHSARWDHSHDLRGRKVAVIGSAASAVQLVPEVAKLAQTLAVFQRSANWVMPKADSPYTQADLDRFRTDPTVLPELRAQVWDYIETAITTLTKPDRDVDKIEAAFQSNLAVVDDIELRKKLTPTHPYGCKRPLVSNDWFPTFNRGNVDLVTEAISEITSDGITTVDGRHRAVDTIIAATGFDTSLFLSAIEVTGRDGRDIKDEWADGARAYLGITVAGFPNLFMLYGPNTNNGSILFMIERQVEYIMRHLRRMETEQLPWIDVRPEVMAEYDQRVQEDLDQAEIWNSGACTTYYRSPSGRIVTQWPHGMATYEDWTGRPDNDAYDCGPSH